MTENPTPAPIKKPRGFATLTAEQRSRIASAGGIAAQRNGTAHRFTPEEAREAGLKGAAARYTKALGALTR